MQTNTTMVTTRFLYEFILMRFNYSLMLVNNQGMHFINDAIQILITHFSFKYTSSTTYYPQRNVQAKSTNKIINLLLTKLVNEKCNDWDKHLHTIFLAYQIAFKVAIGHTFFQLVYGLHPLMPTKYLLPLENNPMDHTPIRVLSN